MKQRQTSFWSEPETLTRKGRKRPMLPSGPHKSIVVHCQSLAWPKHTLCFERDKGRIEFPDSVLATKTLDPRKVDCGACLAILAEKSLYNALLARLER